MQSSSLASTSNQCNEHAEADWLVADAGRPEAMPGCANRGCAPHSLRLTPQGVAVLTRERGVECDHFRDSIHVASRPDERWVADITYVWTDEGWSYLAAILDLYSRSGRRVALRAALSTELPMAALKMAFSDAGPRPAYCTTLTAAASMSYEYRSALARHGVTVSMSRVGNCWDNAVAESFFATFKNELVHGRSWASRLELRAATFGYIETFYNRRRLHSSIGYKPPSEVEDEYYAANGA
jgi:transposase InsO family protein